jgi:hypothetical protein
MEPSAVVIFRSLNDQPYLAQFLGMPLYHHPPVTTCIAAVVHLSKLQMPDGRLNRQGSGITRAGGCVFRFGPFNGSLSQLYVGIISYFLEVYHDRNIDTVVLKFPKVSREMSPPAISLFLFSNVRFSFHTTENKAGDPFKMAEEEYGSGLGKRVAELLLVERFLGLTFRNADQRAMLGACARHLHISRR